MQARSNLLHLLSVPDVADAGPLVALVLAALVVLVLVLLRPAPESEGLRNLGAPGRRASAAGRWTARESSSRHPADVCRTSGEGRREEPLGYALVDSLRPDPVPDPVRIAAVMERAATTPLRAPGSGPDPHAGEPAAGPRLRPSTFPRPLRDAGSSAGPQAPPG